MDSDDAGTMQMPWRKTFLLGFGFFGVTVIWPLYDSYVPIFLRSYGLSNFLVGVLMTIDNYANLFIQPWVGARSDQTRTRWGRRYPYIMVGAPLAALGALLIPVGAELALALLVGAMLMYTLSMATFRSPTVALLGDIFPSELQSKANGVINFMGLLAAVIAFFAGGALYKSDTRFPFWAGAATMLVALTILMVFVREPAQVASNGDEESDEGQGVFTLLRKLVAGPDRSALCILAAILAWSIGITAIQAFFTLYSQQELGLNEGTAAQLLSFYPLAGLLLAIPGGYLGTYLGRRRTILLCLAILTIALVVFLYVPAAQLRQLGAFALFDPSTWFATRTIRLLTLLLMSAGGALTVVTVNVLPMLYDTAPEGQVGGYTGLYYLAGSLASITGPPLGGLLADATGTYDTIFIFAPLFTLLGFLLIWAVPRDGLTAVPRRAAN